MTRMLCSFLTALLISALVGGCSLFGPEEDGAPIDGDEPQAFDAQAELLSESDDLIEDTQAPQEFPDESLDDFGAENLDDELASSDLGQAALEFEEDASEFSDTNTAQVDQSLAGEELASSDDEFSDEEFSDDSFAGAEFEDDGFGEVSGESAGFGDDEFAVEDSEGDPFAISGSGELDEVGASEFGEEAALEDEFAAAGVEDQTAPLDPLMGAGETTSDYVSQPGNEITNLQYKAFENGGTVVIETASPAEYQVMEKPELNQVVVEVQDVNLPQQFKRPYITKDFKQDIATINAYEDQGKARFVIQLKKPVQPIVQKEGNSILVMTGANAPLQATATGEEAPLGELVAENQLETGFTATTEPEISVSEKSSVPEAQANQSSGGANNLANAFGKQEKSGITFNDGKFTGDRISLEFTDTDVRTIIELIAEKSGVNLIMDNDVGGTTSLRLRNVPWDQALLVMLRSQGLGYVKQGNVLRIAKQDTLSQEAQAVSKQIKSEKEAQLLSGGVKVKYIPVSYANVSELSGKLKEFLSKQGKIAFDDRTSSLVITDYGEYIQRVTELVKALDTPPMQVEIAAKLVEARENFSREAGINWNVGGAEFPVGSQAGRFDLGIGGATPSAGLALDLSFGTFNILGDLDAALGLFESQDMVKVLSQPRVVTMNKTKASIKQTTQIPVVTLTEQSQNQVNPIPQVQYRDLNLSLDVTPQITFKGDVILQVDLKREFPGGEAPNGQVEINKRSAKTTVMVKNGKTAVIGGIYQMDDRDVNSGVPLLKDLPLIGNLFKRTVVANNKNELLLFLKPKILKEIDSRQMSQAEIGAATKYDPFQELSTDQNSAGGSFESIESIGVDSGDSFEGESIDDAEFEDF